jgi:hypothetical protein
LAGCGIGTVWKKETLNNNYMIHLSEAQARIKSDITNRFNYAIMSLLNNLGGLNEIFCGDIYELISNLDILEYPIEYQASITEKQTKILQQIKVKNIDYSKIVDALGELNSLFKKMDGL